MLTLIHLLITHIKFYVTITIVWTRCVTLSIVMHSLIALVSVVCLLSVEKTLAQRTLPNGCVAAGFTTCCTSLSCLVPNGDCYCDASCYDTSDCCEDIAITCPETATQQGTLDDGSGSESGSGMGSGTVQPPTTDPTPLPPSITTRPPNSRIFVDITGFEPDQILIIIAHTPGATVEWRKDGEIINSLTDPRVTILSAGGISIRDVQVSDRGSYTVTVSNSAGSDSATFTLLVLFLNIVESTVTVNPESIELTCSAVGFPDVDFRSWQSPSGQILQSTMQSGSENQFESSASATLSLSPSTCMSGNYTCTFTSRNGNFVLSSSVPVDCEPIQPMPVVLGFEKAVYTVNEALADNPDVALKVCVTQSDGGQIQSLVRVTIATLNESALEGEDFISATVSRTLSLPLLPRSPDACVCIDIVSDTILEPDEEFALVLSTQDERIQISRPTALVRIVNDDTVTASIERSVYTVSEESGVVEVCVVLVGGLQRNVSVFLCTQSETAVDGVDYSGLGARRLIFAPTGSTAARVQCTEITIIDDTLHEGDKTFSVKIQTNPNDPVVTLGSIPSATVTIISDDPSPSSVQLINDTPRVLGNNVTVDFLISDEQSMLTSVTCRLVGPGRTTPVVIEDCSSGRAEFTGLPLRLQPFTFRIEGRLNDNTTSILTQREIRLDSDVCWLHPINEGVTIVNGTTAVVEWQATGPRADNKVSSFLCLKDGTRTEESCSSPFTWSGISRGRHTLIITPATTLGCRRHISRVIEFLVE